MDNLNSDMDRKPDPPGGMEFVVRHFDACLDCAGSMSTMTMTNPAPTQSPSDEQGVSFSVSTKCGARNCDTITKIVLLIYVPRKMPITLFSGAIALLIDINS